MEVDASTSTSLTVRSEVISIYCLHRPNITTCGKCPIACAMPERYFVSFLGSTNASYKRKHKEKEKI